MWSSPTLISVSLQFSLSSGITANLWEAYLVPRHSGFGWSDVIVQTGSTKRPRGLNGNSLHRSSASSCHSCDPFRFTEINVTARPGPHLSGESPLKLSEASSVQAHNAITSTLAHCEEWVSPVLQTNRYNWGFAASGKVAQNVGPGHFPWVPPTLLFLFPSHTRGIIS